MNLIYWISTAIVSAFLGLSSYTYLFSKSTIDGIRELGLPDFLRIELAVLKIIALLVLLIPSVPVLMKEWAYAGVGLFFITSIVAHMAHKDSIILTLVNVGLIVILAISNIYLCQITG